MECEQCCSRRRVKKYKDIETENTYQFCNECYQINMGRYKSNKPTVGINKEIKGDPKRFYIIRNNDESGISGRGRVLDGVLFPNGKTIIMWRSTVVSISVYETFDDFKLLHIDCHPANMTEVVWLDERFEKCTKCNGTGYLSNSVCDECHGNKEK